MKNAMRFFHLATFMVALIAACGGAPPTDGQNPDPDPNPVGCEPNCTPPPIQTITRGLAAFNPGGHPIYLDGVATGLMTSVTDTVMIQAREGMHDLEIRGRDTSRLLARASGTEFSARIAATMIANEIRRDYSGDWGHKDSPREATRRWDMWWDCNDPRIPGTSVCIVDDGEVIRGVYPNDLLGYCVDPTDIAAALAEGRSPRVVAPPECNRYMYWGRTIQDASGFKGEEIENYVKDPRDQHSPFIRDDYQRLVPAR